MESKRLKDLAPLKDKLQRTQDCIAAERIICPRHPNPSYADIRLRIGQDKRGCWQRYEPIHGMQGPDAWRLYKACSNRQISRILALDDEGLIEFRRGPSGACLVYVITPDA